MPYYSSYHTALVIYNLGAIVTGLGSSVLMVPDVWRYCSVTRCDIFIMQKPAFVHDSKGLSFCLVTLMPCFCCWLAEVQNPCKVGGLDFSICVCVFSCLCPSAIYIQTPVKDQSSSNWLVLNENLVLLLKSILVHLCWDFVVWTHRPKACQSI